jgi:hypothetical protein
MAYKVINKGLKRTALSVALGMCFAGSVLAQSNTTGNISGTTTAGGTVVIESEATGFRREITADEAGNYSFRALPIGTYKVTAGGQTREVTVSVGTTANIGTVEVVGSGVINAIDVSSVESTTILTSEQIAKIPVQRNITQVALLAPGTVRGDGAFGNLASFGGSSVAENQYFVNGFNITNTFKNLNFGQVPFEGIAEQQVKTGGYGAEFGRSTGGVINLVTKRGTNEFHAGGSIFISPESLKGGNPNRYTNEGLVFTTPSTTNPTGTQLFQSRVLEDNSKDERGTNTVAAVWASGALVKDRLFGYALLQYGRNTGIENFGTESSLTNTSIDDRSPTWLVKLDWNINDNNLLELTAFSDQTETETDVYDNTNPLVGGIRFASLATQRTTYKGTIFDEAGGSSWALKYTGYLTDNFTLSALYGRGESSRSNYGINAAGTRAEYTGDVGGSTAGLGCPVITDSRTGTGLTPIATCGFIGVLGSTKSEDEREQFRIDAEWQLGDHLLRFGYDSDKFESYDAESLEGGMQWRYFNGGIVRQRIFQTGAGVEVDSQAFYIEDRWQVTDNFLAYLGLRWDQFENKNGAGQTFVKIDDQFGPRLGFSWDINGDGKFKLFGNAGRYALPLTATVAVRGASASLFSQQYFTYTGTDPVTGAPLNLVPYSGVQYLNNEFGVAKNPATIASQNLEPMYQDEYILGFQAQLTDHVSAGVRAIYRDLRTAIDDFCDDRVVHQWAIDNGFGGSYDYLNPDHPFCVLYNPGSDLDRYVDVDGDGDLEHVVIGADEVWAAGELGQEGLSKLGPEAERTYKAVELFFEGHWDKFFLQGSYTWAKSYGNTEGGVKSDIGQDDTGTTQDFDYPELTVGATGYLPNDRRHSLKLFGNWEINDQWSLGANILVQSGRPINCIGVYENDPVHYGASYFSCDSGNARDNAVGGPGASAPGNANNGTTVVPRGSAGRNEWTRQLDLNVAYQPAWADGHLTFKADVFNVFNEHGVLTVNEFGEATSGQPQPTLYKIPTQFQTARSFRFLVQYDW